MIKPSHFFFVTLKNAYSRFRGIIDNMLKHEFSVKKIIARLILWRLSNFAVMNLSILDGLQELWFIACDANH